MNAFNTKIYCKIYKHETVSRASPLRPYLLLDIYLLIGGATGVRIARGRWARVTLMVTMRTRGL